MHVCPSHSDYILEIAPGVDAALILAMGMATEEMRDRMTDHSALVMATEEMRDGMTDHSGGSHGRRPR